MDYSVREYPSPTPAGASRPYAYTQNQLTNIKARIRQPVPLKGRNPQDRLKEHKLWNST